MSAEFEITRDKDGFLNCKFCPRIFLTKILFENHSSSQHNKDIEAKQDIHQTKTDQSSVQEDIQFEKCSLGNLSFVSKGDLKLNIRNGHQEMAASYKGEECKNLFTSEINFKRHLQNGDQQSCLNKTKDCNRTFTRKLKSSGQRGTLQSDIDMVHKKLPPNN